MNYPTLLVEQRDEHILLVTLNRPQARNALIISADSRQIYRRLDVGTAKPTP